MNCKKKMCLSPEMLKSRRVGFQIGLVLILGSLDVKCQWPLCLAGSNAISHWLPYTRRSLNKLVPCWMFSCTWLHSLNAPNGSRGFVELRGRTPKHTRLKNADVCVHFRWRRMVYWKTETKAGKRHEFPCVKCVMCVSVDTWMALLWF